MNSPFPSNLILNIFLIDLTIYVFSLVHSLAVNADNSGLARQAVLFQKEVQACFMANPSAAQKTLQGMQTHVKELQIGLNVHYERKWNDIAQELFFFMLQCQRDSFDEQLATFKTNWFLLCKENAQQIHCCQIKSCSHFRKCYYYLCAYSNILRHDVVFIIAIAVKCSIRSRISRKTVCLRGKTMFSLNIRLCVTKYHLRWQYDLFMLSSLNINFPRGYCTASFERILFSEITMTE